METSETSDDGDQFIDEDIFKTDDTETQLLPCSSTELGNWAIRHNITHAALKDLLQIIKRQYDSSLFIDARTLLKTPKNTKKSCKVIQGGEYWHQGLDVCLTNTFKNLSKDMLIQLNVNIDGLPIYKSSKRQFWPILCSIYEMPDIQPMIVGIFHGNNKPLDINEFLEPFVEDVKRLQSNGLCVNGHMIHIKIRCFICDSPARAFIKGVVNFNGINGCLKCTTEGEYSYLSRTVVFPDIKCPLRTDAKFRSKHYGKHHKGQESPILKISEVDMVQDFIVADELHLLELGVMKRCLTGWKDGSMGFSSKLCARDIERISKHLISVKLPSEIHRSTRGLDCLAYWKGVEWRNFLNYIGIVILKDVLNTDVYKHFLLLFVAVRICSSDMYAENRSVAQLMFEKYIDDFKIIYGVQFITSNIHNLEHVVDDVNRFGQLFTISTYPFENTLFQLKKLLRQGNNSLQQIVNRIGERNLILSNDTKKTSLQPEIKKRGNVIKCYIYSHNFCLSNVFKNSWFLTNDNDIVQMNSASEKGGKIFIHGKSVKKKEDFFSYPIRSSNLHIYICNITNLNNMKLYLLENVVCKMVVIKYNESKIVFIPLLHTIKNKQNLNVN
ncbi:uncharacterized protein LOC126886267 [Diabrotica virgifera virgifera]|uniref:Transposase domain-containing protein n=1 Tax=Diabrotica virgifera virgifera TaxID=50390 RepID=A0ABM5KG11_DIAVI|nr:uncharacterized protein LOC126886267 [Diabrotica virgifera virgifera]